jgi:TRAP-type C4-dicarboxylate transport system permease small subunit
MFEKTFSYFQKNIFSISRIGIYVGVVALNAMMLLVVADVILRKYFAAPIRGSLEITEILMGFVVFLGLAFCAVKDEHVFIDIVTEKLSKRAKSITMIIVHFLSAGVAGLMAWRLFIAALDLQRGNQVSMMLGLWLYPFVLIGFIGCALLTLVYIINLINSLGGIKR